jgi:TPP-dependent indolepyruvate ferredoxin oxidoreductase alpha subunit
MSAIQTRSSPKKSKAKVAAPKAPRSRNATSQRAAAPKPKPKSAMAAIAATITSQPASKTPVEDRHATLSEAVRKTWLRPEVAAARRERHAVMVDGVRYGSVRKAFTALGLPNSKHIAFRGRLKALGKLKYESHTFVIVQDDQ